MASGRGKYLSAASVYAGKRKEGKVMKMSKQEKILFLNGYRFRLNMVRQLTQELQELRETVMRITPFLSSMPGSGGPNLHRLEQSVEQVEQVQERLAEELEKAILAQTQVQAVIETLEDERLRQVLRSRYILGQTWEKAAETLGLEERWVRRLHERALMELNLECDEMPQKAG